MSEPRTWHMYGHFYEETPHAPAHYRHIGAYWWVELHGLDAPIHSLTLTEDPEGPYWAWTDEREPEPHMIQPKKFLLSTCFPAGVDAEVQAGRGQIVRLRIEQNSIPLPTDG